MGRLIDPIELALKDRVKDVAPVKAGRACPSCGGEMVAAYSSGKAVMYCANDGVALPEVHVSRDGKPDFGE